MGSLDGILTLVILAAAAAWAARRIWRWARRGPGSKVSGCVAGCDLTRGGCGHCATVELKPEPPTDRPLELPSELPPDRDSGPSRPRGRPEGESPAGGGADDAER
jgi:hypothetical protein